MATLRAHSERLNAVEGGMITEQLHKGKEGDDELLEKLRGNTLHGEITRRGTEKDLGMSEEEKQAKAKERAWLQEQKNQSRKLKEQTLQKQDAWSADMQALRNRRYAKTAGKRWVTHARVQRRVKESEQK